MGNELDKRGSAEVLILAMLEARPRHGYELAQLIEQRSGGAVDFHAASLYPLLYRLERRGLLAARWVEKAGERRRRFYRLTAAGRKALASERQSWARYLDAMQALLRPERS
ncbi:MAG: PadR family transcriptional regulator [Acidobacteria bacterium]|nr:MAG: PadR family transcriptional regulator [Acidobacteriota bacterium]